MQGLRRTIVALGAAACILALVGCGGLGVNIGSGTSRGSQVVNLVGISVQSGPNIYTVSRNGTILLIATAYYHFDSQNYVSTTQGAVWGVINAPPPEDIVGPPGCPPGLPYACTTSSAFTGAIALLAPDCVTPYQGQVLQNICVLGVNVGAAGATTAGITATVAGVTGQVTVNIQ
jgi:hypothetical protein